MDLNYGVVNLELRSFSKGEYHARGCKKSCVYEL